MQIQESVLAAGSLLGGDVNRIFDLICRHREKLQSIQITLRGGSMQPAIPKGSLIRIQVDYKGSYAPGHIVAFLVCEKIMVHRVIYCGSGRKAKNYLLTRGDAMHTPDPPVHINSLLGPVIAFKKDGKWFTPRNQIGGTKMGRLRSYFWFRCLAAILEVNVSLAVWLTKRHAN